LSAGGARSRGKAGVRKGLMAVLILALLGRADGLLAGGDPATASDLPWESPLAAAADVLPLALEAYDSESAAHGPLLPTADRPRSGTLSVIGPAWNGFADEGAAESSSRRRYLPVVLSLLVPGAGEIYMGYYVRGAVLVAAEVTAWTGYAYYHNKGLDSRAEYEQFADDHWSYGTWVKDHALWRAPEYSDVPREFQPLDSIGRNYWDGWPPYHSWHSKEEEKQNYYENIGKYDWFISGWEDWDPETIPRESALRTTYRAMRKKSNDELDNATAFIYLSVAARVVSLVETLILTRRDDEDTPAERASGGFAIKTCATGLASGEVALVYSFR
jgi:hypothetical protein